MWREWQTKSLWNIISEKLQEWWHTPVKPNPWPQEIDEEIWSTEAVPVCHHCFTPYEHPGWFCPSCCAAVGQNNNIMPYIYIFSLGEVLRSGVGPEAHFSSKNTAAYICIGFAEYLFFAPLYYFRLYRNYSRKKNEHLITQDELEDTDKNIPERAEP